MFSRRYDLGFFSDHGLEYRFGTFHLTWCSHFCEDRSHNIFQLLFLLKKLINGSFQMGFQPLIFIRHALRMVFLSSLKSFPGPFSGSVTVAETFAIYFSVPALHLPSPRIQHTQSGNTEQQHLELFLPGSSELLYQHPIPPGFSKFPNDPKLQHSVRVCNLWLFFIQIHTVFGQSSNHITLPSHASCI